MCWYWKPRRMRVVTENGQIVAVDGSVKGLAGCFCLNDEVVVRTAQQADELGPISRSDVSQGLLQDEARLLEVLMGQVLLRLDECVVASRASERRSVGEDRSSQDQGDQESVSHDIRVLR